MKRTNKAIASWIESYATMAGDQIIVDERLKAFESSRYFLHLTLPNRFEKYALALHSFWINYNIPESEVRESPQDDEKWPEEDYSKVKWKAFYKLKQVKFDLNQAILSYINLFVDDFKAMNNELYPGSGLMDKAHLEACAEIIEQLYGNQAVEVFYCFLATKACEDDFLFEGKISELIPLLDHKILNLTPSLIYAKDASWAINTDYDLPFTTIGGEAKLVSELVDRFPDEVYEVRY